MKRVSLFWPFLLIAVGVLWTLGNLNVISPANYWALVSLWPVLLIGLGVGLILRSRWPVAWNVAPFLTITALVLGVIFAPQLGLASSRAVWFPEWNSSWTGWGGLGSRPIVRSGETITQERLVKGFHAVSIGYPGDVTIQQGEVESLTIEADKNVMDTIQAEVNGSTLTISPKYRFLFPVGSEPVHFTLTVINLELLRFSGAGDVHVAGLKTDQLEVVLSGAGNMDIGQLQAGKLTCSISGTGNITVSGKANNQVIQISGLGSFHGKGLQSASTEASISGAGSAEVWAEETLMANISGAGSVNYYGHPQITQHITGIGNIDQISLK